MPICLILKSLLVYYLGNSRYTLLKTTAGFGTAKTFLGFVQEKDMKKDSNQRTARDANN